MSAGEEGNGRQSIPILVQGHTCMRLALQGWLSEESFSVISEMKAAGGFDDIVLVVKTQGKSYFTLIQQKYHHNSIIKITDEMFMQPRSAFYLIKYFDSYLDLREEFTSSDKEIADLVIITNRCIANDGGYMEIVDAHLRHSFFKNESGILVRFKRNAEAKKYWINRIVSGYKCPYDGIEKDAEEFLNLLLFVSKYPKIDKLRELLIKEFKQISCRYPDISYSIFETELYEMISGCQGIERTCITKQDIDKLLQNARLYSEMSSQDSA